MIYHTILCLGDSLTYPARDPYKWGFPQHLAEILKKQLKEDVFVINKGINGETSGDLLLRAYDVIRSYPDAKVMTLMIGTNDTKSGVPKYILKTNIKQIVRLSKAFGKKVVLATLPPIRSLGQPTYHHECDKIRRIYNNEIKDIAREENIALADIASAIAVEELADGVHFTHESSKKVAEVFAKAMEELR